MRGHAEHVRCLAISAGGRFLLTAAGDRHVHLWQLEPASAGAGAAGAPKQSGAGAATGVTSSGGRQCIQSLALEHDVVALEFEAGAAAAAAERTGASASSSAFYLRFAVLTASGAVHILSLIHI